MKAVYRFLEDIGQLPFALLMIATEVSAGLMLLCALAPLGGGAQGYIWAQHLGSAALKSLLLGVIAAFCAYMVRPKRPD